MAGVSAREMDRCECDDGPRIKAGCRWFTVAEAREWWGEGGEEKDTVTHGPRMLAGVDALTALARAHGWEVSQ